MKNQPPSPIPPLNFHRHISFCLNKKYTSKQYTFIYINTTNLIFNETCHIVARFKDYLILDDSTEFLRRFYSHSDSIPRLKKIFRFFETYSKLFPNYMILPESTYLYKNIRKKQKMIDAVNEIKREEEENRRQIQNKQTHSSQNEQNQFFTYNIQNSINKYHPSINNSFYNTRNDSSISISLISRKRISFIDNETNNVISNENDETNLSIVDILSNINVLPHSNTNKNIICINKKQNNNFIYYNNQLLETPRKGKHFIQKMASVPNAHFKSENKSKSQQTITTSPNNIKCIYNNYQNIIIPNEKGNTVININNNFYQYEPSRQVHKMISPSSKKTPFANWNTRRVNMHRGLMSPQPTLKTNTIYKRTLYDNSGTVSYSSHNIKDNEFSAHGYKSPKCNTDMKKRSMLKTEYHNGSSYKFARGINGTTLFHSKQNSNVYTKKQLHHKGMSNIKNDNIKGSNTLHKKQKSQVGRTLVKSQTHLVVNVINPRKGITSPPKKKEDNGEREKMLTTAMRNKYRTFVKKRMNASEVNIKNGKCYRRMMSHSGSGVNLSVSISRKKNASVKNSKGCKGSNNLGENNKGVMSPKNSSGMIEKGNANGKCVSFEGKVIGELRNCDYKIRVNRKVFLDKLKSKMEEDEKNGKEMS